MKNLLKNWEGIGIAGGIVLINLIVLHQTGIAYGQYDWMRYLGAYGVYGVYGPTPAPKSEVVPVPPSACLAAPVPFDPPDGKNFAARSSVFRWKPGFELPPGEVYDILVSTDGGKTPKSIGTTRDTTFPVDFLKWDFAGVTGNFWWTVRVRDASGKYVSCEDKWLTMTLTEIPPAGHPAPAGPPRPPCVPSPDKKCP